MRSEEKKQKKGNALATCLPLIVAPTFEGMCIFIFIFTSLTYIFFACVQGWKWLWVPTSRPYCTVYFQHSTGTVQ